MIYGLVGCLERITNPFQQTTNHKDTNQQNPHVTPQSKSINAEWQKQITKRQNHKKTKSPIP